PSPNTRPSCASRPTPSRRAPTSTKSTAARSGAPSGILPDLRGERLPSGFHGGSRPIALASTKLGDPKPRAKLGDGSPNRFDEASSVARTFALSPSDRSARRTRSGAHRKHPHGAHRARFASLRATKP